MREVLTLSLSDGILNIISFIQCSWRRPDIGISSIDENSITDSENYRHSGMYNKSLHDNKTIRPGFNQRSNQRQDYLNSMTYVGAQSSTSMATHSPPFSDLNPVSLPHLGPSITPRPVRTI